MILDGKRYIYPDLNNKKYLIKICKDKNDYNLMINFLKNIYNNFLDKNIIIQLDFEFNRVNEERVIALMQINIDSDLQNNNIYFLYPPDLNTEQLDYLKFFLYSNKIKKVLHGAEALDIPYLFNNIFKTKEEQLLFTNNLYDTKYFCEYFYKKNNIKDYKCKIYNLLKQKKVINEKQFEFLEKNRIEMGLISNINIDIKNLKKELILYCAFDVLFLRDLYNKFPKDDIYQKLIPEITNIHFILKQTEYFNKLGEKLSKLNINYYFNNNKLTRLNDISKKIQEYLVSNDKILNILININYFRKFFINIIKNITYSLILKNNKVFERSNIITDHIIVNHNVFLEKFISIEKFINLNNYLNNIDNNVNNYLNK